MNGIEVGKEVVTLVDGPTIPKGTIRVVQAIKLSTCACSKFYYDLGETLDIGNAPRCYTCGHRELKSSDTIWYYDDEIAPIQTTSEEADMNEALKEVMEREVFV